MRRNNEALREDKKRTIATVQTLLAMLQEWEPRNMPVAIAAQQMELAWAESVKERLPPPPPPPGELLKAMDPALADPDHGKGITQDGSTPERMRG